ncbi:MAG TPA: DUF3105 domain-containing protein [Kofleriaceae bacterium]|nr:DUF3105 domain-containing protein [Kofleriaceae bacterium]
MCPHVRAVSRKLFVLIALAGCSSSQPPRKPDPCGGDVTDFPLQPGLHVAEGTPITWSSNPPTSGTHYPIWAGYDRHYDSLERGYWVHDLEHGAVVYAYRCDAGCPDIGATLDAVVKALPTDGTCTAPVRQRALVVEDPMLPADGMVVAVSWGSFYAANACADQATLVEFYYDHVAHAPEDTCADGVAFSGVPL